ncbi:hypothetical protein GCM10009744_48320 [Kribbella alba]|uniref:Uncharacterized protein n=1 Tax=Kribbella alba TaxID=190197 RepID=A0ABN2FKK9_9ACTN
MRWSTVRLGQVAAITLYALPMGAPSSVEDTGIKSIPCDPILREAAEIDATAVRIDLQDETTMAAAAARLTDGIDHIVTTGSAPPLERWSDGTASPTTSSTR